MIVKLKKKHNDSFYTTHLKGTLKNSLQRSWNIPEEDDLALGLIGSKSGLTQLRLKLGLTQESGPTRPNVAIRIRFCRVVISTHRCPNRRSAKSFPRIELLITIWIAYENAV